MARLLEKLGIIRSINTLILNMPSMMGFTSRCVRSISQAIWTSIYRIKPRVVRFKYPRTLPRLHFSVSTPPKILGDDPYIPVTITITNQTAYPVVLSKLDTVLNINRAFRALPDEQPLLQLKDLTTQKTVELPYCFACGDNILYSQDDSDCFICVSPNSTLALLESISNLKNFKVVITIRSA
jgi:hypothetical protein